MLQKLARLGAELQGLQDIFKDCKSNSKDTKSRKDEMEVEITNEVEIIRKDYLNVTPMNKAKITHQINHTYKLKI